jgi:hypothetical protein
MNETMGAVAERTMHGVAEVQAAASQPLVEIAVGTLGLIVVILVHGFFMSAISRAFNRRWVRITSRDRVAYWRTDVLVGAVIGSFVVAHLISTLIWSLPIQYFGLIPDMRACYYFVLQCYTTLGMGSVDLPEQWRLLGPLIGMSGLFAFGWTGSVLVGIMTEYGRLARSRARAEDDPGGPGTDGPHPSGSQG